jgi:hypothetical protein
MRGQETMRGHAPGELADDLAPEWLRRRHVVLWLVDLAGDTGNRAPTVLSVAAEFAVRGAGHHLAQDAGGDARAAILRAALAVADDPELFRAWTGQIDEELRADLTSR